MRFLCVIMLSFLLLAVAELPKKTYIVHMAKYQTPATFNHHIRWFESSLRSVSDTAEMFYTYTNAAHGYATRLTEPEAESLAGRLGILSVLPDSIYQLHTTRTPEFLGLDRAPNFFTESQSDGDVIVGVLDTGVWPESKSFDDTGMGPVPSTWKGACEGGPNFPASSCNRKLVGARSFSRGYQGALMDGTSSHESITPRDVDGHGTHTASTAAGSAVEGASLLGYALGTARGMASKARVAVYKVCWTGGCLSSDILAAIDKAIEDKVNVLSLSLGGGVSEYYRDNVAIGSFAAMEHGILVSCSAGNAGPTPGTLSNVAPWITTVGAGTLDRDFPAFATLGNGKNLYGVSLFKGDPLPHSLLPLVYAGNVSNADDGKLCMPGSLNSKKVKGKLVLCDRGVSPRVQKGEVVKAAGGAGMILANTEANGEELVADAHLLPATSVGQINGNAIRNYIFTNRKPTATIHFEGTKVGIQPSPVVAAFSSRGPNGITPEILKPDLIAPGVNILAGWSGAAGPTGMGSDKRRVQFNIISGTSMSCPHVSGLAGLLKGAHPEWSPAAIRSALMTTSYISYKDGHGLQDIATGKPSTPFDHGSGHVNPVSALNPGLVYDLTIDDYLGFLCALEYTPSQLHLVARRNVSCPSRKTNSISDFNYPSFSVPFKATTMKYTRTLTNVGPPGTYKVTVTSRAPEVKISVEPEVLNFSKVNEKKSYTVTFSSSSKHSQSNRFARIEWSDGKHIVGSPIVFSWS